MKSIGSHGQRSSDRGFFDPAGKSPRSTRHLTVLTVATPTRSPRHAFRNWRAVATLLIVIATAASGLCASPLNRNPTNTAVQCKTTNATAAQQGATLAASAPMTQAQGEAILNELREIREMLERGAGPGRRPGMPQNVRMQVEPGWHALGRANAPVVMIEFADLQCPFCRRFETATFAALKKDYIDTGKLRFVARDLPLPMHAYAVGAAEAARCAGEQGKFWQFRSAVLGDEAPPTSGVLVKHAQMLGLRMNEFQACTSSAKYQREVEADRRDAVALGIRGTPAFVIGRVSGGWLDGLAISGARPLAFFQQQIDGLLSESRHASAKAHSSLGSAPMPGFVSNR